MSEKVYIYIHIHTYNNFIYIKLSYCAVHLKLT